MIEIFDDIRKLYRFKIPCEELVSYIEFFSETSSDATAEFITTETFTVKLFSSYTPTIWLNMGTPYNLKIGSNNFSIGRDTDIILLRNTIVERNNHRNDNIFTIKFHPGGFEAVFGISQQDIGDGIVNAGAFLPGRLILKLKKQGCLEERIELLETFFLAKLRAKFCNGYIYNKVQQAIALHTHADSYLSVKQLAGEIAVTEKSLCRYFNSIIGVSPKHYFSTVRARKALIAYASNKADFSPYNFGYCDMGHFRKDVLLFTSQKLSEWQS